MNQYFWQGQVRLRGLEPADAEVFIHWNLDGEWARSLDFVWPPRSEAGVRAWLAEQSQKRLEQDALHWVLESLCVSPTARAKHRPARF